ncbi:hypothetical protein CsatA_030946 [Cannabis sativa]
MEEICIRDLVVVGVISWSVGFVLIRKTFPNRSFEFSNRLVSTIHAIVAVTLASLSVQDWKCPLCPMASTSSPKQISIDNSVHHLVSIIGIGAGLAYAKISFAVIFTIARMVGGPYLAYVTLTSKNPLIIQVMAVGLQLVSAFWFYKIARMITYKLKQRTTNPEKVA